MHRAEAVRAAERHRCLTAGCPRGWLSRQVPQARGRPAGRDEPAASVLPAGAGARSGLPRPRPELCCGGLRGAGKAPGNPSPRRWAEPPASRHDPPRPPPWQGARAALTPTAVRGTSRGPETALPRKRCGPLVPLLPQDHPPSFANHGALYAGSPGAGWAARSQRLPRGVYRPVYIYTYIHSVRACASVCPVPAARDPRGDTDVLFKCSCRDKQYEAPSFLNPGQTLKSTPLYS